MVPYQSWGSDWKAELTGTVLSDRRVSDVVFVDAPDLGTQDRVGHDLGGAVAGAEATARPGMCLMMPSV